jgi:enamine deaminase RidA (YjgF/YER057c/UK114 family)
MENLGAVLRRHGLGFGSLVKCTIYLADIGEWGAFNEAYGKYFSGNFPARTAVGGVTLVRGARVEIDCIAAFGAGATTSAPRF